jgi:uncharacterized membrane protein
MAPQKQAGRRQATGARKRTSHGNNRRRIDYAVPVPSGANGATATSQSADAVPAPVAAGWSAGPTGILGWIRTHPLAVTTWVLSMIGLGVSIYLTITHYDTSVVIACSDKGLVNCEKVTTSAQSMVFNIFPVAVLGLAFYMFLFLINSPLGWMFDPSRISWLRWTRLDRRSISWLRLGSVVVGMGFVIYLVYAELIQIGNICLFCTSVHVVTFLIFVLLVYDATSWSSSAATAQRRRADR